MERWDYKKIGGILTRFPPVFSTDNRFLFTSGGANAVQISNVESGEIIRILESKNGYITQIITTPSNPLQIYTSSSTGHISLWDFESGVVLKNFETGTKINEMLWHPSNPNIFYIFSYKVETTENPKNEEVDERKQKFAYIYKFDSKSKELSELNKFSMSKDKKKRTAFGMSPRGDFIGFRLNRDVHLYNIAKEIWTKYTNRAEITSFIFHPVEQAIAVGTLGGYIELVYCLASKSPKSTKLHWHAHLVLSLAFSEDGSYLLSGGSEGVVVVWQLETGNKNFIPRLGAPITYLTASPAFQYFCFALARNVVKVVNAITSKEILAFQGLQNVASLTGLVVEPSSGHIVTNGAPGSLQFYDPSSNKLVDEIDVVSNSLLKATISEHPRKVNRVVFSRNGKWMITVDSSNLPNIKDVSVLRFWSRFSDGIWHLRSKIEKPHKKEISALIYHPKEHRVVTTSFDGTFKFWALQSKSKKTGEARQATRLSWTCILDGNYKSGLACTSAAFSCDGTILALSFGHLVTLWNANTCVLLHTLSYSSSFEKIRNLTFLGQGQKFSLPSDDKKVTDLLHSSVANLLVVQTNKLLMVWDLLSLSLKWTYNCYSFNLTAHPTSGHFAVNVRPSAKTPESTLIFHGLLEQPIGSWEGKPQHITCSMSFMSSESNPQLLTFNKKREVKILHPKTESPAIEPLEPELSKVTLFETKQIGPIARALRDGGGLGALSQEQERFSASSKSKASSAPSHERINSLFNSPSHLLPPFSSLCSSFLEMLLEPKQRPPGDEVVVSSSSSKKFVLGSSRSIQKKEDFQGKEIQIEVKNNKNEEEAGSKNTEMEVAIETKAKKEETIVDSEGEDEPTYAKFNDRDFSSMISFFSQIVLPSTQDSNKLIVPNGTSGEDFKSPHNKRKKQHQKENPKEKSPEENNINHKNDEHSVNQNHEKRENQTPEKGVMIEKHSASGRPSRKRKSKSENGLNGL